MKIVSYDYFLEHKDEKHDCKVKIKCQKCGEDAMVSWHSLITRQTKYEAICNKCIQMKRPARTLHGILWA